MIARLSSGDGTGRYPGEISVPSAGEEGPDHDKSFSVEAWIGENAWDREADIPRKLQSRWQHTVRSAD